MKKEALLFLFILFVACDFHTTKKSSTIIETSLLPPLDSGIIYYPDSDTVSHLTGKKVMNDTLVSEVKYISFRDSQVLLHIVFKDRPEKIPIGNNNFIYFKDSSIIRTTITENSVSEKKIYSLAMYPSDGKLIVNPVKNRMVFAYEYYHLFYVMDLDAKIVKTIDFKNGNHYYQHRKGVCMDCVNPNTIYYRDAFAGENYFYLLYWDHPYGALLGHANKGWKWARKREKYVKTKYYQQNLPNIVEQYDWNGNPVNRYLLEGNPVLNSGRFVVDEKEGRFYILASECYDTFMSSLMCDESLMVYSFSMKK